MVQAFRVCRAGIEQQRTPRGKRKSIGIPQTRSSASSPGRLTECPRAVGGGSRASGTPSSSKSSEKTSLVQERVCPEFRSEFRVHPFAFLFSTTVLDASEFGPCAARGAPFPLHRGLPRHLPWCPATLRRCLDLSSWSERRSQPWTLLRQLQIPVSLELLHSKRFALPTQEAHPPYPRLREGRSRRMAEQRLPKKY